MVTWECNAIIVKVSVVVPIYNVENYIRECLDGLVRQTLKEIEVIMVNDGSTDNSGNIAKEYASRYSNFMLIERKNGGLSAARNTGMEIATGEYIYFLDSDDYLVDTALEELYTCAKANDLDVLKFVAYVFEDQSKELVWCRKGGYKYGGNYPGVYEGREILKKFIENGDTALPSCCLIFTKRKVVESKGLRFCEGIIHEDNLFHWQLLSLSQRVAVMNKPLYCRRQRAGSITQSIDWVKKIKAMCISIEVAEEFLGEHLEIQDEVSDWYVKFFIYTVMNFWKSMDKKLRKKDEIDVYLKSIKRIAKVHNYWDSKEVWLFLTNTNMYSMYNYIMELKKSIFKR